MQTCNSSMDLISEAHIMFMHRLEVDVYIVVWVYALMEEGAESANLYGELLKASAGLHHRDLVGV